MLHVFKAVARARLSGLLRLRKATHTTRLICNGGDCGLCCNVMGGDIVVTPQDLTRLPEDIIENFGDVIVLKNVDGVCSQLVNNRCQCYNSRPAGCREYPWYSVNGELFYDSGCPGIVHDRDERPDVSSLTPIEVFLPLPRTLRWLFVFLFRLW